MCVLEHPERKQPQYEKRVTNHDQSADADEDRIATNGNDDAFFQRGISTCARMRQGYKKELQLWTTISSVCTEAPRSASGVTVSASN